MASDVANVPNGTYQTSYEQTRDQASPSNQAQNEYISQEEIGWFFVEKYYTTMSKGADRLYLFYNKRSQFLMGTETEKVMVSVGQKAIDDKIREQNIKECKVRVTNVDTQACGETNIVIQVIGEICINSEPQRKFVQTFVLAKQTNGYYVLNDIFRFLQDEDETVVGAEGEEKSVAGAVEAVSGHQEPAQLDENPSNEHTVASAAAAEAVDQRIESQVTDADGHVEPSAANTNGVSVPEKSVTSPIEEAPAAATPADDEGTQAAEHVADNIRAEDVAAPEAPRDPEPSRAASPKQAPAKPSGPKSWASLVSGGGVALPAVAPPAQTKSATPAASATPVAAAAPSASPAPAPAAAANPASAPAATVVSETDRSATPQSADSEWQTAQRHDHGKKHQRVQSAVNTEQNRGYIKNIGEDVNFQELKDALTKFGDIQYFDINRQKRCAFVDWKSAASYQAATAANPHKLSNVTFIVEERHVKPPGVVANSGGFRGNFRGGARGGFNDRGRGGRGGVRGGAGGASRRGGAPAPAA